MGMRCKRHPFQAGGGVCATCLRDRLLVLAAAQNDASSPASPTPPPPPAHHPSAAPPVAATAPAFPRSVSPYVSRRKSDASGGGALRNHPSLLFFRTPQVGPAYGGGAAALEEGDIGYEKRRGGKFSVLSTLFGNHHQSHRSEDRDRAKERKNRSWLAGIMPRRRKKQVPAADAALPPSPPPRRSCRVVSNRGLSPERGSQGSGEESSSPADRDPPWRPSPSPMRKTPCRRRQGMPSGLAVCLSPLVRPSPGRRHRAAQPPDTFSSELRPSPLHSVTSTASVPRCRSRKLADGGRFR